KPPLGQRVTLSGHYLRTSSGKVFVATSAAPLNAAASAYTPSGSPKVAVLLYNFTNDRSQPLTPTAVHNILFDAPDSVSAYWKNASGGAVTLTGDVFGWYS